MDSLTQIVLGASVGEAVAGKKAGNRAILWGAVAGTIPDLDVIPGLWLDTVDRLDFHRGFSHSILFCFLFAPVLGWLIHRIYKQGIVSTWKWTKLAFWCFLTHTLLDACTSWGTQLLWPHDIRYALKTIMVVDPCYTLPFLTCVVWLMFKKKDSRFRRNLNIAGLTISTSYLVFTFINKQNINETFEAEFSRQNIEQVKYETKPLPFNLLWSGTAEVTDGYYMGFYSLFDKTPEIEFHYFQKNHHLLEDFVKYDRVKRLLHLTQGFFTVERSTDGLKINDLRFGQTTGWETGDGEWVFVYYIKRNPENPDYPIIIQKTNTVKDARSMVPKIWKRMMGN